MSPLIAFNRGIRWGPGPLVPVLKELCDFTYISKLHRVSLWLKAFYHEVDHADIDHGLTGLGQPLIVLAVDAAAAQPSEGPFCHPTLGQQHPALGARRPAHDLQLPSAVHTLLDVGVQ